MTLHDSNAPVQVRRARPEDLPAVIGLIHEHSAYEQAGAPADDLEVRLPSLLFSDPPSGLTCFVAIGDDGSVAGYATCSPEISTWQAATYLHMDCLFLRPEARGSGLGRRLVDAVRAHAVESGMSVIQWQTPDWNEGAIRFYDRLGATRRSKQRYTLLATSEMPSSEPIAPIDAPRYE